MPDAAGSSGLTLSASPGSLVIRPSSSGQLRFSLRDQADRPARDYPIDFAIVDNRPDQVSAKLSNEHGLTDSRGDAIVEIIVGELADKAPPAVFLWVQASAPGADPNRVMIQVTANAYSVEILPFLPEDLLGSAPVVVTELYFFDNTACSDLDLHHIGDTIRPAAWVPINSSYPFLGVAASGVHAVVGQGRDSAGVPRVAGCVDVPGPALLDDVTIRALLVLDHLFPSPAGHYQVSSDFLFDAPPTAMAPMVSAWQQWTRCAPLDPARLWLDCTIAALDPSADGKSCVPDATTVGSLGNRLLATRGTPVAVPATTPPGASPQAPCRAATNGDGYPSLDLDVDQLFNNARNEIAALSLGSFQAELAKLLDLIHIESRMTITQGNDANAYWVDHTLLGLTFPDALGKAVSLDPQVLGLPLTRASGIPANHRSGKLTIPQHSFTLRLGTATRYAFEETSLQATRNVKDAAGLVEAVFRLAQWSDGTEVLAGCAALDALACGKIGEPRGCVNDACHAGLAALAKSLADSFGALDGIGKDFSLAGSAPVLDHDADGQADYLGLPIGAAGIVAAQGDWSASVDGTAGRCSLYGGWSGLSVVALH